MGRSSPLKRLRRRLDKLADSPVLLDRVARFAVSEVSRRHAGTQWERRGDAALAAHRAAGGTVIIATWHGRLAMSPFLWDPDWGPVLSLTSAARPGRIVARVHAAFGIQSLPMHDRKPNRAISMQAARLVRQGHALAFACDGPLGPARRMPLAPLDWARLTGAPIWLWSYSVQRYTRLPMWDRMILPRPGGRGVMLFRAWDGAVPKRAGPDELETLRARLEADLDALTLEADRAMGHDGIIA